MPLIKATDPLPESSVIIAVYGDPGVGKTTLGNTCENPAVLDFDRGVKRASHRKDTFVFDKWEDVQADESAGLFLPYKTVVIDTAKGALDDFLMAYVRRQDARLIKNQLKAYGAIGEEFKLFTNNRRAENKDILIVAHSKEVEDGDIKRRVPDVTGQSAGLILRIADAVGYYTIRGGKRMVIFEPTDNSIGKNVAKLEPIEVPNEKDPAFKNFMADIFTKVRTALTAMSEAQKEALEVYDRIADAVAKAETAEELNQLTPEVLKLPKIQMDPLVKVIGEKAKNELGLVWVKVEKGPGHWEPTPKTLDNGTPPADNTGTPPVENGATEPPAATGKKKKETAETAAA